MRESPRILVVDDTPVNVRLLSDLLTAKRYVVATAASGPEALEKIDRETPDLVLLDVMMPGMSGYDVCRKLRENPGTSLLPVVMVTALDPAQEPPSLAHTSFSISSRRDRGQAMPLRLRDTPLPARLHRAGRRRSRRRRPAAPGGREQGLPARGCQGEEGRTLGVRRADRD